MSGHSKFSNIKHKKEKNDAKKGKIFTRLGKEIIVAVKSGGNDPTTNSKLRDAVAKARENNMPNDNVQRLIKKASGDTDNMNYEHIIYEGYGPSGIAVIVDALTDNRNRAAANVRNAFTKGGGNMGNAGCVSYLFDELGKIYIEKDVINEDKLMGISIELEVEEFNIDEEVYEIVTLPDKFSTTRDYFQDRDIPMYSQMLGMYPQNYVTLEDEEDMKKFRKLINLLDDDDDVQEFYHNCENFED
ncbi:MAG: YebC/PmpR family DNA-binding transcriptional regulator [Lachnospirales bacterium]